MTISHFSILFIFIISMLGCGEDLKEVDNQYYPPHIGIEVVDNGYDYDYDFIDHAFDEVVSCLNYYDINPSLELQLMEHYQPFECTPKASGCGGLYELIDGKHYITVSSDLGRLKHEYIHYILQIKQNNADIYHETEYFKQCEK